MPVEIVLPNRAEHGATPCWDGRTSTLLWVDVPVCRVHRVDPGQPRDDVLDLPQHVGAALPRTTGGLVCNLTEGVALLDPDGTRRWLTYWARPDATCGPAAIDPAGRLWAASTPWLAVVDPDGSPRVALDDVPHVSAISWNPDGTLLYLAHGTTVDVFTYDRAAATLSDRRTLFRVPDGRPTSTCVDADDCLWITIDRSGATTDGELRRYTPTGLLDRTVAMPAARLTGAAFGGPHLTDLYVTTAGSALFVLPDAAPGLPTPTFPA